MFILLNEQVSNKKQPVNVLSRMYFWITFNVSQYMAFMNIFISNNVMLCIIYTNRNVRTLSLLNVLVLNIPNKFIRANR